MENLAGLGWMSLAAALLAGCAAGSGMLQTQKATAPPPSASYGTITTVAGTGEIGYSGDGGPATAAALWDPICVALDAEADLYIGDLPNYVVRKVVLASGDISTYAGTGERGYSGDNGPATAAAMYGPTACAVDSAGNLYLADDANNAVRKVSTAGVISTVAGNGFDAETASGGYSGDGGLATSAEINHPFGVAVDSAGDLFIADTANYRVRRVDAATGVITTVAGDGVHGYAGDGGPAVNAELYNPEGLALDAAGNLYIAEQANNTVRKVNLATGIISTVAGTGTYGYSGDGGLATNAELNAPTAVAVDAAGNLYIADTSNMRVRRVTASTGIIQTVAGGAGQGYAGDGGAATSAELNNPHGIAFDAGGAMYIAD